jgi:hypothetical protein
VKDPRRLREETNSDLERILLDAASSYRRPASTRAKTLASLGIAGSAAVSASAARGASTLLAKLGGVKALIAGAAVGAAIAVPAVYFATQPVRAPAVLADGAHRASPPESAAPESIDSIAPTPSPDTPAVAVAAAPIALPVATAATRLIKHPKLRTRARSDESHVTPASDAPSSPAETPLPNRALTAEVMALESARARLAQGDADGTLGLLDQYSASYPSGRLKPEADVLRIDALAKSGRSAAARKLAESFLQHYPNSVLAARARGHLND